MAATLVSPETECCSSCAVPLDVNVPGPPGSDGANGTNGADGLNAFAAIVGGSTLVPAYGASVTVELTAPPGSLWIGQTQVLYVQSYGYFRVDAIPDDAHVTLFNLGYTGNVNGDGFIAFAAGARVQPGGLQGPSGAAGGGAFLVANNLSEGVAATMRSNLGLGSASTHAATDFFSVANNLSEGVAATKRTNLGLGSAAVLDAGVTTTKLPPIDTTFTNGNAVFATASGLQTKTPAAARTALGIGGSVGPYALLQNQQAAGVAGGTFTLGSWVVVPINTKVSDPSSIVTLAANVAALATGAYRIRAVVPGYKVGKFQARLFNISDSVVEFYGTNASSDSSGVNGDESFVEGRLVVSAGPKNYRLEAQCEFTGTTSGFGIANAFGGTQVYGTWEIEQEL